MRVVETKSRRPRRRCERDENGNPIIPPQRVVKENGEVIYYSEGRCFDLVDGKIPWDLVEKLPFGPILEKSPAA